MIDAHRPLTAPTERSISPRSRTRTTPTEIRPTAVICSTRFVRLTAVRKRLSWDWKMIQIRAMTRMTRTSARSPRTKRWKKSFTRMPAGLDVVGGRRGGSLSVGAHR